MDEQQIMQVLNQIPLEVLQNYVAQRTQQEQASNNMAMPPQEAQPMMARGGMLNNWSPMVDIYACGGSTRSIARGTLGARVHKKKR